MGKKQIGADGEKIKNLPLMNTDGIGKSGKAKSHHGGAEKTTEKTTPDEHVFLRVVQA